MYSSLSNKQIVQLVSLLNDEEGIEGAIVMYVYEFWNEQFFLLSLRRLTQ